MSLRRDDGFGGRGDDVYEALMQAHAGLTNEASAALNARLILLLANQVGDLEVIREALGVARRSVDKPKPAAPKPAAHKPAAHKPAGHGTGSD